MAALQVPDGVWLANPQADALWQKLRALRFDSGSGPRTFAARLSEEQGWSAEFTGRVIEEYRRFLLLFALTAPEGSSAPGVVKIVPSAAVDKAWHLHLLYTHSYWDDLCQGVLGRPLHHLPADGSPNAAGSLDEIYDGTLGHYRRVFGVSAPPDIWPGSALAPSMPRVAVPAAVRSKQSAPREAVATWGRRLFWLAVVVGFGLMILAQVGEGSRTLANWFDAVVVFGGAAFVVAALCMNTGAYAPNQPRKNVWTLGDASGGDGASGWFGPAGGEISSSHHDGSSHGSQGGHDAGGHGCGGHSCGGHGCGGHGCGGGCGGH